MSVLSLDTVKVETCESMIILITMDLQCHVKVHKFYVVNFSYFVVLVFSSNLSQG